MVQSVALKSRGVIYMTVLLRNTRTYLVGLGPANLLSLHIHFYPYWFKLIHFLENWSQSSVNLKLKVIRLKSNNSLTGLQN
jgi:hypothetical protein